MFGKFIRSRVISIVFLLAIISLGVFSGYPFLAISDPGDPAADNALNYLRDIQQADGSIVDYGTSTWAVMAIKSAGESPKAWDAGGPSIVDYLITNVDEIDMDSPAELSRFILAMSAAGVYPSNVSRVDYVAALKELENNGQFGEPAYLFDDFWPLIALGSVFQSDKSVIKFIKSNQNPDGGWGWAVGAESDVDDTAAALMALIAAGTPATDSCIQDGLAYLANSQMPDGGFPSWGASNSDSDSWGISALYAAGVDPTTYSKNGNTPISHLKSLQNPDGSFNWKPGDPGWNPTLTTIYAIVALNGGSYPVSVFIPKASKDDDNRKPVANFTYSPSEPTNWDTVQFIDNSRDRDGRVVKWRWSFGDNTGSSLRNPTHVYSEPGVYIVTLKVWDNKGRRCLTQEWMEVRPDSTTPNTTNNFDGLVHNKDFFVLLHANDDSSGVAATYYRVNVSEPVTTGAAGAPFFSVDGVYRLEYWSVDLAGNVEEVQSIMVFLDKSITEETEESMSEPELETEQEPELEPLPETEQEPEAETETEAEKETEQKIESEQEPKPGTEQEAEQKTELEKDIEKRSRIKSFIPLIIVVAVISITSFLYFLLKKP